jgi:hypothetical protein
LGQTKAKSLRRFSSTFADPAAVPHSACLKATAIRSSESCFRFMTPSCVRFSTPERITLSMDQFAGPGSWSMGSIVAKLRQFDDGAAQASSVSVVGSHLFARDAR